jgi:hypothetical protein
MELNNLKPAWKQLKLMNAIQQIDSNEILSIIEKPGSLNNIKLQRFLFGLVIFIFITIFCQGG